MTEISMPADNAGRAWTVTAVEAEDRSICVRLNLLTPTEAASTTPGAAAMVEMLTGVVGELENQYAPGQVVSPDGLGLILATLETTVQTARASRTAVFAALHEALEGAKLMVFLPQPRPGRDPAARRRTPFSDLHDEIADEADRRGIDRRHAHVP